MYNNSGLENVFNVLEIQLDGIVTSANMASLAIPCQDNAKHATAINMVHSQVNVILSLVNACAKTSMSDERAQIARTDLATWPQVVVFAIAIQRVRNLTFAMRILVSVNAILG